MSYQNGFNHLPLNPVGYSGGGGFGDYGGGYGGGGGGYGGRGRGGGGPRRDDRRGPSRGRGGYSGGGGGGRDSRPPIPENSNNRLKKMVIKLGDDEDFDPVQDPPRLARALKRSWREGSQGVCEGFRISVTQQPQKHSYFVVLLLALSRRSPPSTEAAGNGEGGDPEARLGDKRKAEDEAEDVDLSREVLEDLSRAFRGWVEGREWQNVRLCLHFFSLLVSAGLVMASSLLTVYKSLLAVLEEVGGGGDRAERAVRAVGEGLMRSGEVLYQTSPEEVESLITDIEGYIIGRRSDLKTLADPLTPINATGQESSDHSDTLDQFLTALHSLRADGFAPPEILPRYWERIAEDPEVIQSDPYELAAVSMPPEMYEVDQDDLSVGEGHIGALKLFADEIVPSPDTLPGWTLRSLVLDMINIYEVNRKECARLLLALRLNFPRDTFKSPQSADAPPQSSTWSLESLIVSTLLGSMLTLPKSPHKLIYYSSVITELCKISPNTVAPPVGRAVRKIFSMLGSDGLDVEVARRVAEWFAIHLSNFGFQWMWKEWLSELDLPASHPRRAFMRQLAELEVRLAYHDRILDTLPEAMSADGAGVLSTESPDPVWPYDKEDHPLHTEAVELLQLLRQKLPSTELITHIEKMPNASSGPGEPLFPAFRRMIAETILHLGSRSFSHFLNATERYTDVLRFITPDPASRRVLLEGVATYWCKSSQMRLVTVDKYIQYGILEGLDVIEWIFADDGPESGASEEGDGWTDGDKWEMLRMTLGKHVGRVRAIKRRLREIEREDEAARARRAAEKLQDGGDVGNEDDDVVEDVRAEGSKEARDAQVSLDIQATRLEKVLVTTTKAFVSSLLPWCFSSEGSASSANQGLKGVLALLGSGEEAMWGVRARWGWYREYIRLYQSQLVPLGEVLQSRVFDAVGQSDDSAIEGRAEKMVKGVWDTVIGA